MIKKEKLYSLLIFSAIFFSMVSYENHIFYKYYSKLQLLITGIIFVIFFIFMIYEDDLKKDMIKIINRNTGMVIMLFGMLISTILGYFLYGYNSAISIASVIGIIVSAITIFIIIPILCIKYPRIEKIILNFFVGFAFILAIFSILIRINHNHFLGYSLVNNRVASFYYDPNFLGMVLGSALLISIMKSQKSIHKIISIIVFGFAIYLTGSRGTMLAICVAIFIFLIFFLKMKFWKKFIILMVIASMVMGLLYYLYNNDYFRTYQGSNSRAEMITFAFKHSFESPVFGFGYQAIGNYLNAHGFHNKSTHNSLMDFLFGYGYIETIIYLYFIFKILILSLKNGERTEYKYIFPLIFILINSNTILYSFGGIGISSFIFTFVLGMLNIKIMKKKEII